jgi:hypothetical protein
MSSPQYFFVDDSAAGIGGTALTLDAIVAPQKDRVRFIPTASLSFLDCVESKGTWIFGNIMSLTEKSFINLCWVMDNRPFVKIEFDYNYCPYRGPTPHQVLGKAPCACPSPETSAALSEAYSKIPQQAQHIFYMSKAQRDIHAKHLAAIQCPTSVLSSCFTSASWQAFEGLRSQPKSNKFAIIDGQGGWHSQAKGVENAIKYAQQQKLDYDLLKTKTQEEMLQKLSTYKGLIFLPLIEDTCPRVVIEAKLLGLEIITNSNSQHIKEEWWKDKSVLEIEEYLKRRPDFFWKTIQQLCNTSHGT